MTTKPPDLPSPPDGETPVPPPSPPRGSLWTAVLASGASVLMTLDVTIVNVALPDIADDLDAGLESLQWVISAYTLAFAALLLAAGSISDRIGRRRVFGAGTALFTLASAACGAAPSVGALAAFRGIQGCGAAMVMATSLAMIAAAYEGRARQTAIGIFSGVGGAAAALGPLIGGGLVDGLGWRWIFYINVPVGVLVVLALRRLPDDSVAAHARGRFDLLGVFFAVTGLFAVNYGVTTGPDDGWSDPWVAGSLAVGALLIAGFVIVEFVRPEDALLDVRLFRIPSFTGALVASLFMRIISFGLLPFLILWLQGGLGNSPFDTGVKMLAITLPILVIAPLSGLLLRVLTSGQAIAAGFVFASAGVLALVRVDGDSSWTVMLPGFILMGIGGALAFPPLMGVAVGVVPPERAGMASGATNMFFPLGTSIGIAVCGAILTARIGDLLDDETLTRGGVPADAVDATRDAVTAGQFGPAKAHPEALDAARDAFADALGTVCLVVGILGLIGAVLCLLLIRERDQLPFATDEKEAPDDVARAQQGAA